MMASRERPFARLRLIAEIYHSSRPAEASPIVSEHCLDFSSRDNFACIDRGYGGVYRLKLFGRCDIFVALQLAVGFRVRGHDEIIPRSGLAPSFRRLRQSFRLPN